MAGELLDVAQGAAASATLRAARVMQGRRPECEEPPMRPSDA